MSAPYSMPASHAHYMRPLDGIRGLACLLVVASHIISILDLGYKDTVGYIGSFGVLIFFVLSGFLMSTLYTDKAFGMDVVAKYSIARFTRIAPAYWIAVVFALCMYFLIPDFEYQMTPFHLLRSAVFMGNQGVFWSIPPEVQFYVFFLGLWFAWSKFKEGHKLWLVLITALCLAFIATRELWGGLMLPAKLHVFLVGFLAAFLPKVETIRAVIHTLLFQIAVTLVVLLYAWLFVDKTMLYVDLALPVLIALWIASLSGSTGFTAPFETETMRVMGAASFSIYLFHDAILHVMKDMGWLLPDMEWANIALLCVISLAIPVAFHYMAEKKLNLWSKVKLLGVWEGLRAKYPRLRA